MKERTDYLSLREIQMVEVNILRKFVELCDKHNLKYFLVGGTLLGSIRHNGFIPWDDDIDVAMPRDEYERFISIISKNRNLDDRIIVRIPGDKSYQFPFIKIVNQNYEIAYENYKHDIKHYVWVDVFPFDHFPDEEETHRKYVKKIEFLKWVLQYNAYSKMSLSHPVGLLRFVFAKIVTVLLGGSDKLALRIDKIAIGMNKKFIGSSYVGDGTWPNGMKDYFHVSYFTELVKHDFEGIQFNVPKEYDAYLTDFYGDYMTLPPVEKRETHHVQVFRPKQ